MVRARNAAMGFFIVFMSPEECFRIAELHSRVGIELKPSAEEARSCVLHKLA